MTIAEGYLKAFRLAGFEKVDLEQDAMATIAFRNNNTNEFYGFDGWHLAGAFLEENDFIFNNESDKAKFEELLYPDRTIKYFVSINEDYDGYAEFNTPQEALDFYVDTDFSYARTLGAVVDNSKVIVSEYHPLTGFSIDNKPLSFKLSEDTEITSHEVDLIEDARRNMINPRLKKYNQFLDLCFYINGLFDFVKEDAKQSWDGPENWNGVYANKNHASDYIDIQFAFAEPEKVSLNVSFVQDGKVGTLVTDEISIEKINGNDNGLFDLSPELGKYLKQMFEQAYVHEPFIFYSQCGGEKMTDFYEQLDDQDIQYPPDFSSVENIKINAEENNRVTLTVAEVADFHDMGELHEGIESAEEAIRIYNQIPPERMRGLRSIGIKLHGNGDNVGSQANIYVEGNFCLDNLDFCPDISNNPKAWKLINELREKMPLENILSSNAITETLVNEEIDEESVQEFEESFRFSGSGVTEESKKDFNKIIDSVSEHIEQLSSLMSQLKSKADVMNAGRTEVSLPEKLDETREELEFDSNEKFLANMAVRQKNGR